ncbi:hypothetical protein MLD38_031930 [Melastoma candidum]|uniref:Uncharacterized protein n=1 Tax=Melastoma candidum TaxID=119954 RepID=A0ACB9MRS7_9MYRT|nr:hypothetical protein MLD38_031930 [Melastoma candidum]
MESGNNCNDLRTASFAVYLSSPVEERLAKKLGDSSLYSASFREDMNSPLSSGKIATKEGDMGVFGDKKFFGRKAEDYPSCRLVDDSARTGECQSEVGLDRCGNVSKSRSSVTSSTSSESGWNIRAALSRGLRKNPVQGRQTGFGLIGKRFFRRLGCNKSCSDEKSIHAREEHGPKDASQQPVLSSSRDQTREGIQCSRISRTSSTGSKREDIFAFPVFGNILHKVNKETRTREEVVTKEDEEVPRLSIEVFGSGQNDKKKLDAVALNMERKLSILTWDAIPKPFCPKASLRSSILNDDQESEASSDLYEIENISGTAGIAPLFAPHPPENFSSYEPSEASIEWSVVMASVTDLSAISEYEEKEIREINSTRMTSAPSMRAEREREGTGTTCRWTAEV